MSVRFDNKLSYMAPSVSSNLGQVKLQVIGAHSCVMMMLAARVSVVVYMGTVQKVLLGGGWMMDDFVFCADNTQYLGKGFYWWNPKPDSCHMVIEH